MWLDNLKIRLKLYLGFGLVLLLLVTIMATSFNVMGKISRQMEKYMRYENMEKFLLAKEIDHLNWTAALSDMFLTGKIFDKQLDPTKCSFGKWYYNFKPTDPEMQQPYKAIEKPHIRLHESAREITKVYQEGNKEAAINLFNTKTLAALGDVRGNFETLKQVIRTKAEEGRKESLATKKRGHLIIWSMGILALLIGGGASVFLGEKTARPLLTMVEMLKDIAQGEGDLTKRLKVKSRDEIGELAKWFNVFLDKLSGLIRKISGAAEQVAASSEEMTASSEEVGKAMQNVALSVETISRGSNEQNRDLQSVNKQMSDLNSSAEEIAASSQASADAANQVSENARTGGESVVAAVNMMQEIKDTSSTATEAINKLNEEAKKIGNIVNTITTIAEQTNLLALNAAIEAARAGEQGRGFAVVADEVRKLAENSASAAGEITSLINVVLNSVDNTVKAMNQGNEKVESGVEVVNKAGDALEQIIEQVGNVTHRMQDISAAAEEQAASFTETLRSTANISEIAKDTSGKADAAAASVHTTTLSSQELASSAQNLAELAQELQLLVNQFKVDDIGAEKTGMRIR